MRGEPVLKLFMNSSTMMKKERAPKAPAADAACAENIVVTAASAQDRIRSANESLLGGIHRPTENKPQAPINSHAASETVRAFSVARAVMSFSRDQRRSRMSSLIRHIVTVR